MTVVVFLKFELQKLRTVVVELSNIDLLWHNQDLLEAQWTYALF